MLYEIMYVGNVHKLIIRSKIINLNGLSHQCEIKAKKNNKSFLFEIQNNFNTNV